MISVALCTYNGEKYLAQQIESILIQSVQVDELVIVDDNSTDQTEEVIKSYANKFPIIKFFKNTPSLGVIKNFERAISLCSGEYIALSDQDDVWLENKLEKMITVLNKKSGMAFCDLMVVNHNLELIHPSFWVLSGLRIGTPEEYLGQLLTQNFVTGCACLFTKEIKENALPFPDNIPMHDYWLAITAASKEQLYRIPESLIKYRQHGNNVLGSVRYSKNVIIMKLLFFWKIDFKTHHKQYLQKLNMIVCLSSRMKDTKKAGELNKMAQILSYGGFKAVYFSIKYKVFPRPILRSILFQFYLIFIWFRKDELKKKNS